MSEQQRLARIALLEAWIKATRDGMQYADHGAWGQDSQRLTEYQRELQNLRVNP